MAAIEPLTFHFTDDDVMPNHPRWPMLIYKGALDLSKSRDPEGEIENCSPPMAGVTANGATAYSRSRIIIP